MFQLATKAGAPRRTAGGERARAALSTFWSKLCALGHNSNVDVLEVLDPVTDFCSLLCGCALCVCCTPVRQLGSCLTSVEWTNTDVRSAAAVQNTPAHCVKRKKLQWRMLECAGISMQTLRYAAHAPLLPSCILPLR